MAMTDPITDMLNQIRNAQAVKKTEVLISFSKLKNEITNILLQENFIGEVKKVAKRKNKVLKIALKYNNDLPAIEGAKRVSKPGQRIYSKSSELKKVRGGFGISIISTPKGLMTNVQARKAKLGGEVICEIW
ncbi:MAG: 30S ribosomal protein S8 [Candidatus Staskawiczbacteria bacterium RIFCSPHIGHO2_02_FULL_33_16]|uniref:Small ribosomal subunit protein uS8 n=1 Tax=Candidatus Staskawiczbacteria bacterium RIFCSPHIGHO2_02_FULL_33_16 TaxID=1802204 RepID=A0A1G2HUR8_9BACT|nr:MAG: 30S ribosomal protein S8 [Candidatus Staskawiczbacteria bacterium RIFCSPHIGHO2_02_FULL_33_16]OGZ70578.1 MAG: 30S ribosomal protein S8 [Candidatus Staskawiczbacteria bacterium RIFCSPLOWO2_01_FULL_33_13]